MSEKAIREESTLIRPTTDEEVAYIASRAEEANLATEAGSFGFTEPEASEEEMISEETLAGQGEIAGEQSGMVAGSSSVEDTTEEQLHEEPQLQRRRNVFFGKLPLASQHISLLRVARFPARGRPARLCSGKEPNSNQRDVRDARPRQQLERWGHLIRQRQQLEQQPSIPGPLLHLLARTL